LFGEVAYHTGIAEMLLPTGRQVLDHILRFDPCGVGQYKLLGCHHPLKDFDQLLCRVIGAFLN
jgi:hypothetical protein